MDAADSNHAFWYKIRGSQRHHMPIPAYVIIKEQFVSVWMLRSCCKRIVWLTIVNKYACKHPSINLLRNIWFILQYIIYNVLYRSDLQISLGNVSWVLFITKIALSFDNEFSVHLAIWEKELSPVSLYKTFSAVDLMFFSSEDPTSLDNMKYGFSKEQQRSCGFKFIKCET